MTITQPETDEEHALSREAAAQATSRATNTREFDTARRAEALAAGAPVTRTAAPGLWIPHSEASTFLANINTRNGTLALVDLATAVRSTMPIHHIPVRLGLGPDAQDDGTTPVQLVFATRTDLHALAGYARSAAANMLSGPTRTGLSQTARIVDAAMSMPMQGRIAALTDALSDKYYLPTPADPKRLADWADAFGLGTKTVVVAMRGLAELATTDSRTKGMRDKKRVAPNPMSTPEFHALSSAAYGASGMSAVRAHRSADRVQEQYSGLLRADAELLPRNLLTGDVSRVEVFTNYATTVTGSVSQPFVMKAGRKVEVMLPDALGQVGAEATIAGVKVADSDDSELVVTLKATRRHIGTLRTHPEFYIYQAPFSNVTASRGKRWLNGDATELPDVAPRDVPLDVILAGAPQSDATA